MYPSLRITCRLACALFALVFLTLSVSCQGNGGGKAIATVDGTPVTEAQLDEAAKAYQNQLSLQGRNVTDEQLTSIRGEILESLIRKTALLNEAEEMGVTVEDSEVKEELDKIKERFPSDEQYEQALESQGYTEESLRGEIRDDLIISGLIDREVLDDIELSEEEIVSFFEENSNYFVIPESVTASHILIQVAQDATEEEDAEAREKIDAILVDLNEGADFAETAKEESEGPSATSGGDLGTFGRGKMVPEFEEVAFSLEPGELSDVVKTQFGYHIIYVRDREEGRTQSLDEVREDITEYLKQRRGESQVDEYINSVVEDADIERRLETTGEPEASE